MKTKTNGLRGRPDFLLLVLIFILLGFGLVMVFSASSNMAMIDYNDPFHFVKLQFLYAVVGTFAMLVIMNIPYVVFKKSFLLYFIPAIFMLILVLIPGIGEIRNGARSWFGIGGFGIQPTEFIKLGLILYLGTLIAKKGEKIRDIKKGLLPVFVVVGFICGLISRQPDLGGCIVIAGTSLLIIVAGGANLKQLFMALTIISLFVAVVVSISMMSNPDSWQYRIDRFTAFLDPTSDEQGTTFQLSRSLQALGHGGWFGTGFGNSVQKLTYLPYAYSDFIFAIIAEEFGFVGSVLFLLVYLLFIWRGLIVAVRCQAPYGTIVGVGIVSLIGIQTVVNIGGVTGAMPLTGVTLPFISHGGSSLFVTLISMGVLLSISRDHNKPDRQTSRTTKSAQATDTQSKRRNLRPL